MSTFIKIAVAGAVAFIAIAVLQEWQVFFGSGNPATSHHQSDPAAEAAATEAVKEFISMARHLYDKGDTRFSDRLPASEDVAREVTDEIAYLRRNGRVQRARLVKLETPDVTMLGADRIEVRTKEYWVIRTLGLSDGKPTDPVRSEVVRIKYRVQREGSRWLVVGWDLDDTAPAALDGGT